MAKDKTQSQGAGESLAGGAKAWLMEAIRCASGQCASVSLSAEQMAALGEHKGFRGFKPFRALLVDLGDPYLGFICAGVGPGGKAGALCAMFEHGGDDLLRPFVAQPGEAGEEAERKWEFFLRSLPDGDREAALALMDHARCAGEAGVIDKASCAGKARRKAGKL